MRVGNVSVPVRARDACEDRTLLPFDFGGVFRRFAGRQSLVEHLQWIMRKDVLGQDMFLIGPPGPVRRELILWYAALTNREVEYMQLSRDSSEADLKQRREIVDGSVKYVAQAPLNAALHGRLLVIEGVEKAERNVLPTLNNLLENREMALADGRFLVAPARYEALLKEHAREHLAERALVPGKR